MTEKKFTDKLNKTRHAVKKPVNKRSVLLGMKPFYPDVILEIVKNSYSGEGSGLLTEKMSEILKFYLKNTIPDFMELYAADVNCVRSSTLGYVSLSAQQILNGGYISRA